MYIPLIEAIKQKIRNRKLMWQKELEREQENRRPVIWIKSDGRMFYGGTTEIKYLNLRDGMVRMSLPLKDARWLIDRSKESTEGYLGYVIRGRPDEFENTTPLFWIRNCQIEDVIDGHWDTIFTMHGEMITIGDDKYLKARLRYRAGMADVPIID